MSREAIIATIVLLTVSASLPLYLHGLWIILRSEVVTWSVLVAHLRSIIIGLLLTAIPIAAWMVPRVLTGRFSGTIAVHMFLAIQAYALLMIGLWGIVPIYRAKREHNLYHEPNPDLELDELDERMPHWRRRLRVGVFGYLTLWLLAYLVGVVIYVQQYVTL